MRPRAHWKSFSLEENLDNWVTPLVDQHIVGIKSKAEFFTEAIREKVEKYVDLGIHPWSRYHKREQETIHHVAQALLVFVAFAGAAGLTRAQPVGWLSPLDALQTWNVAHLYSRYGLFIDFALFFALFGGLAQATLGRVYGHRGIALSLGAVLAVALTASESVVGFSVRSLGPFAALVLLGLLGATAYHGARAHMLDKSGAAALAVALLVVGVLLYVPGLGGWAWLGVLAPALLVFAAYRAANRTVLNAAPPLNAVPPPELADFYPKASEERHIVQQYLTRITQQARKSSEQVVRELAYVMRLLEMFSTPSARTEIARRLAAIPPKSHELKERLAQLRAALEQLRNFDKRVVGKLSAQFKELDDAQRKELGAVLGEELAEQDVETKLENFGKRIEEQQAALETLLQRAAMAVRTGNLAPAREALSKAIAQEQETAEKLDEMEALEQSLAAMAETALNKWKAMSALELAEATA
jgi:hypothetical protein